MSPNGTRAASLYQQSLLKARAMGDQHGTAVSLNNLGGVAHRQGDLGEAADLYEQGLAVFREIGQKVGVAISLLNLGNAVREQGDNRQASDLYKEGLPLAQELGDKESIAESLQGVAALAVVWGQADHAACLMGAATAVHATIDAPRLTDAAPQRAELQEEVRAQLGERSFSVAREAGRALVPEESVAEALTLLRGRMEPDGK